jgi:Glycosyl transferase family 2
VQRVNVTDGARSGCTPIVAAVVIGRNEGERLVVALRSVLARCALVVYVDSGSKDGSVESARALSAVAIDLDMSLPFTAARARNAGFRRVVELLPDVDVVQFVDGDCEILGGWFEAALQHLAANPAAAAVFGTQRERYPRRSIFNQHLDMEWRWPVGTVKSFAGNFMCRAHIFSSLGGFREALIAAEDSELSVRVRHAGGEIHSLEKPMALHDANMLHVSQWLRRTMRAGHAFAEGVDLHGAPPERHFVVERRRSLMWGLMLPVATMLAVLAWGAAGLGVLVLVPLQIARIFGRQQGERRERAIHATLTVLGKPAEALGALRYLCLRQFGRRSALIEYK